MSQNPFEEAIDRAAAGEPSDTSVRQLPEDQRRMLQTARLLSGAGTAADPSPEFLGELRTRLQQPSASRSGVDRRTVLLSGLGAMAAGIAAGIGVDRAVESAAPSAATAGYDDVPMVGANGHWEPVGHVSELPDGGVKAFSTKSLTGFLVRSGDSIRGLSGVCTHMGCLLEYEPGKKGLVCPCHGAQFALNGWVRRYPNSHGRRIPDLPEIKVRVRSGAIEVWSA